ncbi:MAG: hypothetical protein ACRD1R_12325 [Acidobacteriota bacterium]
MTVFFWTLDSSGQGKFISAGHNPAYVFRSASGEICELTSSGLIMGAFPFSTYEQAVGIPRLMTLRSRWWSGRRNQTVKLNFNGLASGIFPTDR